METTKQDALPDLAHFTGTEHWYQHRFSNLTYTDGVRYVAHEAEAYWLIDVVASAQISPDVKAERFQAWKLAVADSRGVVTCEDGDGREVYRQDIAFTDFPAPEIRFYLTNNVLMLPSEY